MKEGRIPCVGPPPPTSGPVPPDGTRAGPDGLAIPTGTSPGATISADGSVGAIGARGRSSPPSRCSTRPRATRGAGAMSTAMKRRRSSRTSLGRKTS
ncbi:MAG: hypothetical protein FJ200_01310 [Gemmatimonadetes bacterium]|nr:hypothetical protein [Gemmatimonadota bacterium]